MKISLLKEIINTIKLHCFIKKNKSMTFREKEVIEFIRLKQVVRDLVAERDDLIQRNFYMRNFILEHCGPKLAVFRDDMAWP